MQLFEKLGLHLYRVSEAVVPQDEPYSKMFSSRSMMEALGNYTFNKIQRNIMAWRASVDSTGLDEPPTPFVTSELTFLTAKLSYPCWTWKEIKMLPNDMPYMIVMQDTAIGKLQHEPGRDLELYYDPAAGSLDGFITSYGVTISVAGAQAMGIAFSAKHGVRVFHQAPSDPACFAYLGDYVIHKTGRTLTKEMWEGLDNKIQDILIGRFVANVSSGYDDPAPGRPYSLINVQRMYAKGGVLPFVYLRYVGRMPNKPEEQSIRAPPHPRDGPTHSQAHSFLDIDSESECSPDSSPASGKEVDAKASDHLGTSEGSPIVLSCDSSLNYRIHSAICVPDLHSLTARAIMEAVGDSFEQFRKLHGLYARLAALEALSNANDPCGRHSTRILAHLERLERLSVWKKSDCSEMESGDSSSRQTVHLPDAF